MTRAGGGRVKTDSQSDSKACPWPLASSRMDVFLFLLVTGLVLFGLLMVYSSSFIYAQEKAGDGFAFIRKQLLFAGLGFAGMGLVSRIDYRFWAKGAYPLLGVATVLLILSLIPGIGARVGGAQRWIRLQGWNFQPSELAKFAVIFYVSFQLQRKRERLHTFVAGVLSHLLVPLPALVLLLVQPDFGTTVMIVSVVFCLMFLAGVPRRYLLGSLALVAIAGAILVLGSSYRRNRMMVFMDPWRDPMGRGFQVLQSFVGLYHGRLLGVGLGNGKEKLFYLPEAHNDFIAAVIGEELGFLGILALIAAYVALVYRGFKVAWDAFRKTQDEFALYLASGITLALGLQGFVNLAVVMGLLPTKGLTLPLISYGGSALLIDLLAIGVLQSVARGPTRSDRFRIEREPAPKKKRFALRSQPI